MIATLNVFGSAVSCSRCLALITEGLNSLEGVISVSADKSSDTLTIDYDKDKIDETGIREKIRSAGFYREHIYCIC